MTFVLLTDTGYIYREYIEYSSYNYDIELIGHMDSMVIKGFISYLLDDEKILERKNISLKKMAGICDYNVLISFCYDDKEYDIPDDIFCSNNKVSKYNDDCLSSRIKSKLFELAQKTEDFNDYLKRKELRRELKQIDKFLEMYGDNESDIPDFLKKIREKL